MKLNRLAPAAVLTAAALTLTACGGNSATGDQEAGSGNDGQQVSGNIVGIGASSQKAAIQAWTTDFSA